MKPLSATMVESPAVTWNLNSTTRYSSPVIKSCQRPFTNPGRVRGSTNYTTIKLSSATSVRPHFGVRRFRTIPEQVCRRQFGVPDGRVSYTLDYIRYLKRSNKETEAKLKETMNVLSMQRSQSDLDTGGDMAVNLQGGAMFGTGILGSQRSRTYFGNIPEHLRSESIPQGNKQEVKIGKAVVPRKGLIQLTSSDAPTNDPFAIGGKGQQRSSGQSESKPYSPKGLIRRKSILRYIEAGTKLLEESEEIKTQEEEMTKSLGEYTILDLQSKILEMTDSTSQRKRPMGMMSAPKTPLPEVKKPGRLKDEGGKGVSLPAIKQLKIF